MAAGFDARCRGEVRRGPLASSRAGRVLEAVEHADGHAPAASSLMREAISGHQRSSVVISSQQRSSGEVYQDVEELVLEVHVVLPHVRLVACGRKGVNIHAYSAHMS